MKRSMIIKIVLCVSILMALNLGTLLAYATSNYSCLDGRHEYESEIIHINTEYEDGEVRNTCIRCGYSSVEILPATGHQFSAWEIVKPPTETNTGIESRYCTGCGRVYKRTLPMLHVFNSDGEPQTMWVPNAVDYLLTGGIGGVWIYTVLMLWYNGLVINWDRRERLKKKKERSMSDDWK